MKATAFVSSRSCRFNRRASHVAPRAQPSATLVSFSAVYSVGFPGRVSSLVCAVTEHVLTFKQQSLNACCAGGPFDEGAAQVANLLKRDEAELTGKVGIGQQAYEAFGEEAGEDKLASVEEFPDAFKPAAGAHFFFSWILCCSTDIVHVQQQLNCFIHMIDTPRAWNTLDVAGSRCMA